GSSRTPAAIEAPISLSGSGLIAKLTPVSFLRTSSARWPSTTTIVSTPPARSESTQHSMTVLFPKGSSGLNAPMRLERPAARRMAVQDLQDFTWLSGITLEVAECAQGVLARHLLTPLIDEVCVVEWSGFDVGGFSG